MSHEAHCQQVSTGVRPPAVWVLEGDQSTAELI